MRIVCVGALCTLTVCKTSANAPQVPHIWVKDRKWQVGNDALSGTVHAIRSGSGCYAFQTHACTNSNIAPHPSSLDFPSSLLSLLQLLREIATVEMMWGS